MEVELVRHSLAGTGGAVAIVRGEQALQGTDIDSVLSANLSTGLRAEGFSCENCKGSVGPQAVELSALEICDSSYDF